MPELPEVETTRRGLAPHLEGRRIRAVTLRRPDLRWPIPPEIAHDLPGQRIATVRRRAKYLLMDVDGGSALLHLGMSGSLRVLPVDTPVRAHDHVDIADRGLDIVLKADSGGDSREFRREQRSRTAENNIGTEFRKQMYVGSCHAAVGDIADDRDAKAV